MTKQSNPECMNVAETLNEFDPSEKLNSYFQLLMDENKKINLVSRETSTNDLKRMSAESLFPLRHINHSHNNGVITRYLDIGSGGGFPAVPIILTRSPKSNILVERTQKKASALKRMLTPLGIQAEILDKTYEDCQFSEPFDLITMRYVKMTPKLLRSIRLHLAPDGKIVYYSTPEFSASNCESFLFTCDNSEAVKSYSILSK